MVTLYSTLYLFYNVENHTIEALYAQSTPDKMNMRKSSEVCTAPPRCAWWCPPTNYPGTPLLVDTLYFSFLSPWHGGALQQTILMFVCLMPHIVFSMQLDLAHGNAQAIHH